MVGGLPVNARRSIDAQMGVDTVIRDLPGTIVFDQRLLMAVNPHLSADQGLDADELARIFDIPAPDDLPGNVGALIDLELLDGRPDLSRISRAFESWSGVAPGRWRKLAKSDR
jgi:hypothetical protein